MLRFLFPRLTPAKRRGQALFDRAVKEARAPGYYAQGGVPDTLDGRFAMLSTACALVALRLEAQGEAGAEASAALTERFVEAMDAEHRQMGISDPALGRKVRKMVGALARRIDLWRPASAGSVPWEDAVKASIFPGNPPSAEELDRTAAGLRAFWAALTSAPADALTAGHR